MKLFKFKLNLMMLMLPIIFLSNSCKSELEKRIHILPEDTKGWYYLIENQKRGSGEKKIEETRLFLYTREKKCMIASEFGSAWGTDKFLTLAGVEIVSNPDVEANIISIRLRKNGFYEKDGKKIKFQAFFVGNEIEAHEKREKYMDELEMIMQKAKVRRLQHKGKQ